MKRVALFLALVLLLGGAVADASTAPGPDPRVQVFGYVGDRKVPVAPGSVFARGVPDGGGCRFEAPIGVGVEVRDPRVTTAPQVTMYVDESCRAVVESVGGVTSAATRTPPEDGVWVPAVGETNEGGGLDQVVPMHAGPAHRHTGWAKSTVLEQFGVTATEVYAEMRYWQDRTKVYNGFGPNGWCYHSAWPGWRINGCYYSEWNPNGPSEVRVAVIGDFTNNLSPPFPDYAHRARFVAVHPDFWANQCHVTRGVLPSLVRQWKLVCAGGRSGPW